jgi:hypothetical protein
MASELIATGSVAATSSDITVAAGSTATVFLKDADGGQMPDGAKVAIEIKDSGGVYNTVGWLTERNPAAVISAAGTYRARRYPTGAVVGVGQG